MIEILLYSLQGYPQVLEIGLGPALCQTFLLVGHSKHGKVFDGEVLPIDQSGGAICGVGTVVLGIHGANIRYALHDFKTGQSSAGRMRRQSFGSTISPKDYTL
jgi:hypothetical protein